MGDSCLPLRRARPLGNERLKLRAVLGAIALLALASAPARAQIYSWRDPGGTLVLSDHPPADGSQSYAISRSETAVRTTRPAEASRPDRYESIIARHARQQRLDPDLVRAVIQVESGFDPKAQSPKGALGLMQLMPATAAEFGVRNPFDPAQNIRAGTQYLRTLLDRYHGDERLALAAYNAGPGTVDRYGQAVPPYAETRRYLRQVQSAAGAEATAPSAGRHVIYKTIEMVNGRPVPRYSDTKPASGPYEVVNQP
ncbi:MAG: lytic transglycosylase domain-containing protein [Acidobacteriota bacterium]|nr:lytic transglycosylase domain-containing protein [Acidobacteriota bacterium]